ncbi:MAG TPA: type II secretion system protein [Tepidisphaeraceae bacterium]|nr:type II secretion system protein [Tepidisphaeraceae bacterium]
MRKTSSASAFTLIEILIVLTILGISFAVVAPMIGDRGSLKAASAARKVIADLNYIQNMAIATQKTHFMRFNPSDYDIAWQSSASADLEQLEHPIDKMPFVVYFGSSATSASLADVTITSVDVGGMKTLAFDAFGSPQAYDSTTKTLTDISSAATIKLTSGTSVIVISVQPFTGEISVD